MMKTNIKTRAKKVKEAPIEGVEQAESKDSTKISQKKLIQLQQADGKLYNKKGVRSIDELLGFKSGKYSVGNIADYEKQISKMNTSDLQAHAAEVGVMPNTDRTVMIKRLLREFQISGPAKESNVTAIQGFQKPITQETLDILAQGR